VIKKKQGGYKACGDYSHQTNDAIVAGTRFLLVDLLVDGVGGFGLLLMQEGAQPGESLVANDENGGNSSLSMGDETSLLNLLDFRVVDLEDMVFALTRKSSKKIVTCY
jgi:hypothetical protein